MRVLPRWLFFAVVTVVLILAALASLTVVTVRDSFPQTRGTITLHALDKPVRVVRDQQGIPQVYADSADDLFAAQGYVHAQDRFFEMDLRRHLSAGRLSELFGSATVQSDVFARTLGWRRVAEEEYDLLSTSGKRYLESYAAGVNAYISSRTASEMSLEYAALGLRGLDYRPEAWTPVDSLAWMKVIGWNLSGNLHQEVEQGLLRPQLGDRAADLLPRYDPARFEPIVARGAVGADGWDPGAPRGEARPAPEALTPEAAEALRRAGVAGRSLAPVLGGPRDGALGSNSWVVSGKRTANGRPLLANDPHLGTSIPSQFTQIGLHCTTISTDCPFDVAGFSFSGLPGIVIGHNAEIAWGLTTSYLDTQDLVLEQLRNGRVRRGEEYRSPVISRVEQILVAGEQPRAITVRSTSNGPLISDADTTTAALAAPENDGLETAVALSWTGLTPTPSVEAIFALNQAKDFAGFRDAARQLRSPSQNLVYADVRGNIGYQLPGDAPIRRAGDGLAPVPGWDPAYGWDGMIPFEQLPYAENPERGFIVAANQPVVAAYPRPLTADGATGWRSQRIVRMLAEKQRGLTVADTEAAMADDTVPFADRIVPVLLRVPPAEEWVGDGQRVLVDWDRKADPGSAGAVYFNLVMRHILAATFDDELPPGMPAVPSDRWYAMVADLVQRPGSDWWDNVDTAVEENRDTIIAQAMLDARRDATVLMSQDPAGWEWGKEHVLTLRHPAFGSTGIGAVDRIFNSDAHPVGGGVSVVEAWGWDGTRPGFEVTTGPVMRMVVDLGDLDNSRWVNLSGASGHAYHPNYQDQLELIATDRSLPWRWQRERIEQTGADVLTFLPDP